MSDGSGGKVAVAAGGGILAIFAGMGRFADDCGRAAVHGGDDLARMGNVGDDLARGGYRSGDDLARGGVHTSDDLARSGVVAAETGAAGERAVENVAKASPKELGFQPAVARQAERFRGTAPGPRPDAFPQGTRARFVARPDAAPSPASSFAEDLTRGVLEVGMDASTVADLVDGLLSVQEMAEDADDGEMVDEAIEVEKTAAEMTAEVERHLATLSPQARLAVERQLGPPEVIAYRLAEGRPLRRGE